MEGSPVEGEAGLPTPEEVAVARERVAAVARSTPLERSWWLSERTGRDVHLKLECWQPTRSFKVRGAANAVLRMEGSAVVTASAGNHGLGVALAAGAAGVEAVVFVPAAAPETKRRRIAGLGARLVLVDGPYDEAEEQAVAHARASGSWFVHPTEDPSVVAGQATVGLEILEQLPDVAEVLVPVGGGGLIAGIGAVTRVRPAPPVVTGVQSEVTRTAYESLRAGRPVRTRVVPTLADGLAGGVIGDHGFERLRQAADRMHLVPETAIRRAVALLYREEGIVAEGAGAVGVAALLEGLATADPVVVVISGGNIDPDVLASVLTGTR